MPKKARKLSDAAVSLIAARFKVLGEPARLKLLIHLESGEKSVSGLVAATGFAQANVSRHLQALAEVGLVSRRKEAQSVYYRTADAGVYNLCEIMCGCLKRHLSVQPEHRSRIGERTSLACESGRRARTFVHPASQARCGGKKCGPKFSAGRRKPHARGACSPFDIAKACPTPAFGFKAARPDSSPADGVTRRGRAFQRLSGM